MTGSRSTFDAPSGFRARALPRAQPRGATLFGLQSKILDSYAQCRAYVKKSPKPQRCGGVQGGARGGMGRGTDRVSACEFSPPRARPRKRRSGRKVGQDARARGGERFGLREGDEIPPKAFNPIFGVFSVFGVLAFNSVGFTVNPAVPVKAL